jgi:hypothetical protein
VGNYQPVYEIGAAWQNFLEGGKPDSEIFLGFPFATLQQYEMTRHLIAVEFKAIRAGLGRFRQITKEIRTEISTR